MLMDIEVELVMDESELVDPLSVMFIESMLGRVWRVPGATTTGRWHGYTSALCLPGRSTCIAVDGETLEGTNTEKTFSLPPLGTSWTILDPRSHRVTSFL